jgi:hypothetical protein
VRRVRARGRGSVAYVVYGRALKKRAWRVGVDDGAGVPHASRGVLASCGAVSLDMAWATRHRSRDGGAHVSGRVGKLGSSVRSGCCRRICSHRTAVSSRACLATFRSFCLWVHAMVTHAMFSSLIRSVRSTMGWIPGAAIWSTSAAAQHGKSKSRRIPIHPSN